jgi:hypothetical protein
MRKTHYEADRATFTAAAYGVRGYQGIAFRVLGWTTAPDEDTEWTGIEERTGEVSAYMVGDDRIHVLDVSDIWPMKRRDYCGECGQVGCSHDGLDRDEEDGE